MTLIGANGAGKRTMLNSVAGLVKSASGRIIWNRENITEKDSKTIVSMGLVLIPERRHVFPNLRVDENLCLGASAQTHKDRIRQDKEHCFALFPRLKEQRRQPAGTLSSGEQQMLALAQALWRGPSSLC
ncbi:MAG: ATP-binding cassette domain-containing protein [Treponema sp.]|nr:ATP-binding cassette domain-containing protein [Treponema sp.]